MNELNFDSGVKIFSVNGKYEIQINPTDNVLAEQLFTVFDEMQKRQETYKAQIAGAAAKEIFEVSRKMDADMREMLDSILGGGACAAIFGTMSVHALADGFPVWANLLLAVMDKMDESLVAEQKRMNPRMEKYRKKFGKYMKK